MRLVGEFGAREKEILAVVRRVEAGERADHPLERLMRLEKMPWGIAVETTGIHLARRIGEALRRTWHEHVDIRYAKAQDLVRVTWKHAQAAPPARRGSAARRS